MDELVYLDGKIIPLRDAAVSATDYGFLFGYGLFETMRTYGGSVFRLERHLSRLYACGVKLGIPIDTDGCKKAVERVLQANGLRDARVRLTASIGAGSLAPDPASCGKPTILVTAMPYVPYSQEAYEKGFCAVVSSIRRNSQSPIPAMKTANYLESLLARREAHAAGADDALLLNERGQLAEASASNVFLVSKGVAKTPRVSCGILPGITREAVLELGLQLSLKIAEEDIRLDEIHTADEAFLTNSLIEVMPLTAVSGKKLGSGNPGAITRQLMSAYKALVARFISGR